MPQGSVLGPTLYFLCTSETNKVVIVYLPETNKVIIGTFANNTVALTVDKNPIPASAKLQKCLDSITLCLKNGASKLRGLNQIIFTYRQIN